MVAQEDLDRLIDAMRANGVTQLDIEGEGVAFRLALDATPPTVARAAQPRASKIPVKSPAIGTFVARGDDDGLTPLEEGAQTQHGEILGYIAQGMVRLPIIAPASGRLVGTQPDHGKLLGYGDVIFQLEAEP